MENVQHKNFNWLPILSKTEEGAGLQETHFVHVIYSY